MSSLERRAGLVRRLNLEAKVHGLIGSLTGEQWKAAVSYFGGRCAYCGHSKLTVDHVIPQARMGNTTVDNIVPACYPCNVRKGDRLPSCCRWFFPRQNLRRIDAYLNAMQAASLSAT
jgi:5-methylcytosine-specific restriction endonuclease McrA